MPDPQYSLTGNTLRLPKTRRSKIPYEMESLSPRETWGAGNNSISFLCRTIDTLNYSIAQWIKDMVGEVSVTARTGSMALRRYVPEPLAYGRYSTDGRVQFCSILDQTEQGGRAEGFNFAALGSNWPFTDWQKYRAVFEAFPYAILDEVPVLENVPAMGDVASAAGAYAGARELYRYVIRSRKTYSREQPIPGASTAGGFKDTTTGKAIGQIGFQVVGMADVTYKWVRVPVGWPPPVGYLPTNLAKPWPPKFNPAAVDPTTKARARDTFIGSINDDWFDVAAADGYAHPPGTLLYLGYDDSYKYYDAAGQWVCDIVFSFKQKRAVDNAASYGGWNYFLNAQGQWVLVTLNGLAGGTKPYKTNNFNNLFEYS